MITRHFADCIVEPPLPGYPPTTHCARATLAELERAIRDSACTGIVADVPGLGLMPLSKAEVRDRLQALRRRHEPPAFLYISIDNDGRILFDALAEASYKVHDIETGMAKSLAGRDAQAANRRELA